MFRRSIRARTAAIAAAAVVVAAAGIVQLAPSADAEVGPGALTTLNLNANNRRAPIAGLYDWSHAGYRGGADLPGNGELNANATCQITPSELDSQYGVRAGDSADDTAGLQAAIDAIRTTCSATASYTSLSLITLPAGILRVSREIHVDADYLVLRGAGSGPSGTSLVYRPDANTAYDTLTADGSDWDEDGMVWAGQGRLALARPRPVPGSVARRAFLLRQ